MGRWGTTRHTKRARAAVETSSGAVLRRHARRHALGHAPVAKLGVVRGNQAPDVADSLAGLKGRHDVEEGESARIQHAAGSARTSADSPVETAAEAAGRSLADIAISPQVSIYITDDIAAARDRERPHIAFYIGGMGVFYHQYMHRIGFGAEADRIRRAYLGRERERAAQLLTDEMVDAMTIIGSPRQCRKQMQTFFDAGVQEIRLVFNEPNKDAYLKALKAVAPRG